MAKLTLNTIGSRYGSIDALNDNFDSIENALENTLSRDGTTPNTMTANLDMNSQRVINLPDGTANSDAVTVRQLNAALALIGTGTGGTSGPVISLQERVVATSGQTSVTILLTFVPGSNNLAVYLDGVRQYVGYSYTEVNEHTVLFSSGLHAGAELLFITNESVTSADTDTATSSVTTLITATAGQTVFPTSLYAQGTSSLQVFVNGLNVNVTLDYTESTNSTITFNSGLTVGDEVKVIVWSSRSIGTVDAANSAYTPAGTGAVATNVQAKLRESVSVINYDSGDDTTALQNALLAGAGQSIVFEAARTFVCTDVLTVPENTTLNLNGSTIQFVITGSTKCVDLQSGSRIFNGTIDLAGSGYTGSGDSGSPIAIGDFNSGVGVNNVVVDSLTITANKADGNGITVSGDCYNIDITNITFPSSTLLARPILLHWGNTSPVLTTAPTTHPHNINIKNIKMGTMTSAASAGAGIFLSAVYNVSIDNVTIDDCQLISAIWSYAGDYGNYYTPTGEQDLINTNVVVSNVAVKAATKSIIYVDCESVSAPVDMLLPAPLFINVTGTTSSTTLGAAALQKFTSCELRDCKLSGGIVNISTGQDVTKLKVIGGTYTNAQESNVSISNGFVYPVDCVVDGVTTSGAGVGGGSHAGVLLGTQYRTICKNNKLGAAAGETAVYGVRQSGGSGTIINSNYVFGATSSAYSIGVSTSYDYCIEFMGNDADSGIATLTSGMNPLISHVRNFGATLRAKILVGQVAPTAGTWVRGDTVYDETPTASSFIGWVCTTAGTPGTWKTFGAISA